MSGQERTVPMTPNRKLMFILPAMASLMLTACSPTIANHGHQFVADETGEIKPGVTTKQEVAQMLGSPSSLGTFDDDRWYYVSQRTERKSFYQSQITDQQVLAITFGSDGVVSDVKRDTLAQAEQITPVADVTPTAGNELTFAQQLLGNVGRFNSPGPTKERPPFWNQRGGRAGGGRF